MNVQNVRAFEPSPSVEDVCFRADLSTLKGRLYSPKSAPRAAVLIHSATGVPQGYYSAFATWLSETQGLACMTYDYRDFGRSATEHPRNSNATMVDWGLRDQPAAQAFLERTLPGVPIWIIGHSLGGLMVPFHEGASRVARMITVASGPVHVRDHPWPYQALARAFWFGPVHWLSRMAGFMPGKTLRFGEDLPLGVYLQWKRWCTTPGFMLQDVGTKLPLPDWKAVTAPMKIVAVSDDDMVPPRTVWRLMQAYPQAMKKQLTLDPKNYRLKNIGHLGAFARRNAAVWPDIIAT